MKYYFQFTILSRTLYYLGKSLETILKHFPDAWYDKYVPNTGGLLTLLTRLCDLNQWLFTKSLMFNPKSNQTSNNRTPS
jgi:hypothetical protein